MGSCLACQTMDDYRQYTYTIPMCFRAKCLRIELDSESNLSKVATIFKEGIRGRGFLRVQIGDDVFHHILNSVEDDLTVKLLQHVIAPLYEPRGTHKYGEVLCLALYAVLTN